MRLQAIYIIICIAVSFGCKSDVVSKPENKMVITTTDKYVSTKSTDPIKTSTSQSVSSDSIPEVERSTEVKKMSVDEKESIVPKSAVKKPTKIKKAPKKKTALQPKKVQYASFSWQSEEFDFGEITEGDVIEHTFKFTNTGKVPLEIGSVTPSCGCTQPSYPFLSIDPGVSNEIGVTYNSVSKEGDQVATVTVVANTNPKTTILRLKGTVIPKTKEDKKVAESDTLNKQKVEEIEEKKTEQKGKRIMKDANTKINFKKDN